MRRLVLAFLLLVPLSGMAGFEEGVAAYNRGDYAAAIAEFEPLAEQGNVDAQYVMGTLYHYGYGKPHDEKQAAVWFRRAADQGNAAAQYYLGLIYEKGEGVPRDLVAAHMWFELSAVTTKSYRDSLYAKKAARELEKRMKEGEIARAKSMAAERAPKN